MAVRPTYLLVNSTNELMEWACEAPSNEVRIVLVFDNTERSELISRYGQTRDWPEGIRAQRIVTLHEILAERKQGDHDDLLAGEYAQRGTVLYGIADFDEMLGKLLKLRGREHIGTLSTRSTFGRA